MYYELRLLTLLFNNSFFRADIFSKNIEKSYKSKLSNSILLLTFEEKRTRLFVIIIICAAIKDWGKSDRTMLLGFAKILQKSGTQSLGPQDNAIPRTPMTSRPQDP